MAKWRSSDVVNDEITLSPGTAATADPVHLALRYAPAERRPALFALFALDGTLERLARHTREPLVAQMRLAWWRESLTALDREAPPAEPLLRTLARDVLARGVRGETLAVLASGWEVVLGDRPLDDAGLERFARERGATLFRAAASVLGADAPGIDAAGEAWALALPTTEELADEGTRAAALADARLGAALAAHWPRAARPLGALALLATLGAQSRDGTGAAIAAAWRIARFRLSGR